VLAYSHIFLDCRDLLKPLTRIHEQAQTGTDDPSDRAEVRDYETSTGHGELGATDEDHDDFGKGERGKFYEENAVFRLPLYLDKEIEQELTAAADKRASNYRSSSMSC